VAAAAGALAGLRALLGGRRAVPAAIGLLAWAAAGALGHSAPTAGAVATLVGAVSLGLWLWLATARRLLARFVAAFVVSLLAVIVLTATVLSGLGGTQLVQEELRRLADFSGRLADEIGQDWPADATLAAQPYRAAGEILPGIDPADEVQLARIYGFAFSRQDFPLAWERVEVTGVGVSRMRLGSAPRVGVYRGQVNVVRPGEQAIVPALRQVIFAGRRLPASQPLGYRSADPWDTVWMTHALQLDAETGRLARGIERSYGAEPQPLAFYAQFAPDADPALNVLARTARERDDDGAFGAVGCAHRPVHRAGDRPGDP
jgi:hypothetical protein